MTDVYSFFNGTDVYSCSENLGPWALVGPTMMTHKYMGSIVAFSICKSVEPNEEDKEMTSGFQQGNVCKR